VYYVRDPGWKGAIPVPPGPGAAGGKDDDGYRKVPVRVCDAAAEVLAGLLPGERGKFPADHNRPNLDRYISRLKERLAAK
jgi:hypothetical protein